MATKHHILLLGGTGICGTIFTRAALEAGHKLTLYVRTPSKIPADLSSSPLITVIQGELGDEEGLSKAAACEADTFISLAGPALGKREGSPITNALKTLYPLLLASGTFKRVMVLSTGSYSVPEDSRSFKWFLAIQCYIRIIGGDTYGEIRGIAQTTVDLGDKCEWTVFRVPLLQGKELNGKGSEGGVNAMYIGDKEGRDGYFLDRGKLVRWILQELEERKWIWKCPALANA